MKQQSDEWIIQFYTYLNKVPSLWKKYGYETLRTKPIIRLTNGDMVSPYDSSSSQEAKVYLPAEGGSEYPTVK